MLAREVFKPKSEVGDSNFFERFKHLNDLLRCSHPNHERIVRQILQALNFSSILIELPFILMDPEPAAPRESNDLEVSAVLITGRLDEVESLLWVVKIHATI